MELIPTAYHNDEYITTALPWIKRIPQGWRIVRANRIFQPIHEFSEHGDEELLSVTSKHGVIKRSDINVTMFKASSYKGYKLCWENDLVINSLWAWQGGLGISPYHGIVSTAYHVFRIKDTTLANLQYINFLLRGQDFSWELQTRSKGIWKSRYQLSEEMFLDCPILLPPIGVQEKIVRFLGSNLKKANRVTAFIQAQIDLLSQQKQALIDHHMTKGINQNVSRIYKLEELAGIPEHWNIGKLRQFILTHTPISHMTEGMNDQSEVVFLPMDHVTADGKIDNSEKRLYGQVKSGYSSFARNDVLVAKITPCFENGKGACLLDLETPLGFGSTEFIVLRARDNLLPEFLYYLTKLSRFRKDGASEMTGSAGQKRLPIEFIYNFIVGVPPLDEQRYIVQDLRAQLGEIQSIMTLLNKQLDLIRELHVQLVSDTVCGRVNLESMHINFPQTTPSIPVAAGHQNQNNIFLSYCHYDTPLANLIEAGLKQHVGDNISITRDVRDVPYRASFKAFMQTVGNHDYVVMIISDHYLKSRNCMYEALEVLKESDFEEKMLYIIVSEADKQYYKGKVEQVGAFLYSIPGRVEYIKYWERQFNEINSSIDGINDKSLQKHEIENLGIIKEIRDTLPDILKLLSDRKGVSVTELVKNNFQDLVIALNSRRRDKQLP